MPTSEATFVPSGDLRIWTESLGDRRARRPPVLLIMGTSSSALGWPDELVASLVRAGRQVLRFDHRDTGRSTHVDFARRPYTIADMAADAVAVLDGHRIGAAHVVGASLGGTIAQWLAIHRPTRVASLTAIMSGPLGYDNRAADARALAGHVPAPDDLPGPVSSWLAHLRQLIQRPPVGRAERIAAAVQTWRVLNGDDLPFDEDAAKAHVEAEYGRSSDPSAAAHHDLAAREMTADRLVPLSEIVAPTLVIHGTADPLRPLAHGRAVAAQIPGARFVPVPGMGHGFFSPHLPGRIAALIQEHTQTVDAESS